MRVERLSKSWLLRYERGSVLLFARNAYAIQEALLICRGYRGALEMEPQLYKSVLAAAAIVPLGKKRVCSDDPNQCRPLGCLDLKTIE